MIEFHLTGVPFLIFLFTFLFNIFFKNLGSIPTAGLNTSNFQTLSGITTVSQSGNFGYHTYRSGGVNSSASGNISGVTNLVMVDHGAYNSLEKKTNTLYFIPE